MNPKACNKAGSAALKFVTNTKHHSATQFELSKVVLSNLFEFKLSPGAKLVLIYLVDCFNPSNETVYPRQQTIAGRLGLGIATVKRAIKELISEGIIICESKNCNHYRFTPKIFEKFKMIPKQAQNDTKEGIKMIRPCINKKEEQKKNSFFQKGSLGSNARQGKFPAVQDAFDSKPVRGQERFERETIQKGSPLDFSREQAIEYIESLPIELKERSYFARELRKIHNIPRNECYGRVSG